EQPRRVGFEDWIIESCPVSGPSIIYDNSGILHMTYKTKSQIYYSSFDAKDPINNETSIEPGDNPSIVYNELSNRVYVSYENYELNSLKTRVVEISKSSKVKSSSLILPTGSLKSMFNLKMIYINGKVYMNWEDDSEGNNNIWFAEYISTVSSVTNNLFNSAITNSIDGDLIVSTNTSNTKLVVSDMNGRILIEQELYFPVKDFKVNVSNINSRLLFCNLISSGGNTSRLIIK
ncbi:MAG: hypothetical protein RIF34_07910, partial [Candidatus Kapaibacterium sp.]